MHHLTRTLFALTMTGILSTPACAPAAQPAPPESPRVVDPGIHPGLIDLLAGRHSWHTFENEAGSRRYRLYLPTGYHPNRPLPLVVLLHGCTQDPDDFARGTRFDRLADSAGVIVAYPEQTAAYNPQKCWNWYDPAHQGRGAGEPALIAGITRQLIAIHAVDPARVYIAGVSAGGAMAVNTAAAYPELYAAAGAHSAIPYRAATDVASAVSAMRSGPANPDALPAPFAAGVTPVPLIVFHGTSDPVVNAENGRRLADQWRRAVGAKDFTRHQVDGGGLRATRDVSGPFMELWLVEGLGHAWSGGSPEGTYTSAAGPDASREMLRFFLQHPVR
jgi:poly(hydroxyalkanoate) depolymerase family esterase